METAGISWNNRRSKVIKRLALISSRSGGSSTGNGMNRAPEQLQYGLKELNGSLVRLVNTICPKGIGNNYPVLAGQLVGVWSKDDEGVDSMIHFCTCTGRAASSLEESRKQEAASSCKICGQKPLAYERGALSGSMLSSVGLELPRVIDPDLSWTVPKSSKRATRRARASLTASNRTKLFSGSLKGSEDLIDKDPKRVEDMPVSESEKLGVSILGRRFSDAVENVPIKKRKFPFVRSPSPTPQTPPRPKESGCLQKCLSASNQKKSAMSSYAEDQTPTTITAVSMVLDIQLENFKVDVDQNNSLTEKIERYGDDADFSGISILAAAACSGNIDCSSSNLEDPASDSSLAAGEASSRFVQNTEPSSLSEELGLKHLADLSVLDSKTDRSTCIVKHLEKNISAAASEDHQEDLKSSKCPVVSISEKSMDVLQDLPVPAKENETPPRIAASMSRDDRSHWDLNVVMDAWESPCDEPAVGSKSYATLGIVEDGMQKEQATDFEHCQLKMELGDTKDHSKMSTQHNVGGTAVIVGQDSRRDFSLTMQEMPPHSDSLAADVVADKNERTSLSPPIIHRPNVVERQHDLEACTRLDSTTCSLVETHCETDSSSNVATVVPEETKPLHSPELVSFDAEFTAVAPVECEVGPASHDTCSVTEESTAVHSISFDGERKGEIVSLHPIVGEETNVDHTTHPSQPHGAGHVIVDVGTEGKREAASVADPDKQLRVHITSCDHGGEVCHARSPNPRGDLDHMGSNNVSVDGIYSSSVVSPDDKSEAQLMADRKRCEASCLRSPEVEKHVASCTADSDMEEPCQLDDSLTQQTSGLPVDGNFSTIIAVDGNAIDRSKPGEMSSSHLDASVHESLNPEEWPTPVTFCQGDKAVAVMKEDDDKTSMVFDVDVKDTGMTTHVHTDPKDKESPKNVDLIARTMDTSAVIGGSVSLKVCQSNEDDLVYGSGEVAIEDSFNSDYESDDVSLNDNAASAERVSLLYQADDDYQYEDGEFREPVIHCWGEDEGEEREAERVDYGSDNIDTDPFEPSADHGVVDHDECKEETLSEASRFCQEGKLDGEMNEREPSCQPSLRGSLETKSSPAEPGERRAMELQFSRKDIGRKDDNEKLTMDVEVVSELNAGGDKVLVHEELGYRESCHSAILRMKSTGWDRLPDVSRNSRDAVMDVRGSGILKNPVTRSDSSDADRSLRRVFRPTSNRELSSRIDGANCSDASVRKDKVYVDGNRSNNLDERDSGLAKSIGRGGSSVNLCGRGRAGNHLLESSGAHWGQNRHHSPGYYGPGDHGLPGPKNAAAAAAAKLESSGFVVAPDFTIVRAGAMTPDRVRRQSASSPSQNLHRSLTGRGSSTDRDGALGFGMPLGGHGHVRDISPSRSLSGNRGRSSRYALRVCGTGQRERYNGPSYSNDIGSSLPIQHPLPRRQRSFSPMPRRSHRSRSRTKSLSRSRSRSPHMWTSGQGGSSSGINRGPGLRRQLSRSPDFRMETRIRRMRSPHRRQGFPEHMIGFVQAPRNHNSPSHASRWIDDRRGDAPDHFREHAYKRTSISERSSPGRGFSRNHRFDLMDSPGRIKTDDYFRPMHSGRFPEFSGGGRGRPRHDESDDDRRKPGERYGMVDSIRHFDNDGIAKRFRYDVEECFGNHQPLTKNASESSGRGTPRNFSRGIESRLGSGPKRDGEGRNHFRYDRDRKHNVNFKTFGIRERDEDAEARRRRPT